MDMARPYRPSHPFLAMPDGKINTPSEDPSSTSAISTEMEEASSRLRFHMGNSVWDVIQNEVMEWRDSSWTSMNLPGSKTCENTF